jgi:hypothetical protein
MYRAAYEAHANIVRRAFVVAARRLDEHREPIHRALISAVRYYSPDAAHITLVLTRESGAEVRYGIMVRASDLDAVTEEEITDYEGYLAARRYEDDVRAYTRMIATGDDCDYLRTLL